MKPIPQKLLHYTTSDTSLNYILKNKTLRFNSFKNVNDPKEAKDWPFKVFCFYEQNSKNFTKELFNELHDYVMNNILISCFSILNNNNLYEVNHDLRMWSQYGNNHEGVCIVFNKEALENTIKKHQGNKVLLDKEIDYITKLPSENLLSKISESKYRVVFFNKFFYQHILPLIHPFKNPECLDPFMINLERLQYIGISKYMRQHIHYYYKELLFTKNECWKDEREYRYILHTDKNKEYIDIPIENSIEAVILGNDFSSENYPQLFDLSQNLDFKIYRIYSRGWENHFFEINKSDFNEEAISLDSSFPLNFEYENLFTQICDSKGNNRISHFEFKKGTMSMFH